MKALWRPSYITGNSKISFFISIPDKPKYEAVQPLLDFERFAAERYKVIAQHHTLSFNEIIVSFHFVTLCSVFLNAIGA